MKIVLRVIAVYFVIAFVGSLLEVARFATSVSPNALRNLGLIGVLTLAGWALGYAYFVVCLLLLSPPSLAVIEADETPAAPGSAR